MKREQNMTTIEKLLCCLITACASSGIITAQTAMKTITGSVTDSEGQPIPGASVTSTEGSYGTITDTDGNFTLKVPEKTTLLFSCLGYNDQKMRVSSLQHDYHVSLNEDSATHIRFDCLHEDRGDHFTGCPGQVPRSVSEVRLPSTKAAIPSM